MSPTIVQAVEAAAPSAKDTSHVRMIVVPHLVSIPSPAATCIASPTADHEQLHSADTLLLCCLQRVQKAVCRLQQQVQHGHRASDWQAVQ
jgi:hypothetical protein